MNNCPPSYDEDFGVAADWAVAYRQYGVQVVPCKGKTPNLKTWKEFQTALVPQSTFEQWYGYGGAFTSLMDMGMLTGSASGRVLMIDLDLYKGPAALNWWRGVLAVHNNSMDLETWEQLTGGGGRQMFFRYPEAWRGAINAKTDLNVDIRGQAGFAVLPPTLHASGHQYEWQPGRAPWDLALCEAPPWLLEEVDRLVREHGGGTASPSNGTEKINMPHSGAGYDGFGFQIDGRESYMRDVVWAAMVDWYRECPIKPGEQENRERASEKYDVYAAKVVPQGKYGPTVSKTEALELEGRGPTEFWSKWQAAIRLWETKVRDEADRPNPREKTPKNDRIFSLEQKQTDSQARQLLLTAEQFVAGFTPPAYLIDGIIQRGYLYSLTARTGAGKTAIAMYIAQCIARGVAMHGCPVKRGTVLLLAGENPDDIRARFLVLAEAYGFVPESLKMRFVAGVVNIATRMTEIRKEAELIDDLVLVIVDTAAAYFPGDETNSNSQQGAYARTLRELTFLPGLPAVLVNCHPIKNASRDNLLPMGGSAFLNEVDGNLTLWANAEKQMTLHWLGKFRGPEFDPMAFEIDVATSERVKDAEGRLMPNAVAKPITDSELEAAEVIQESDEDRLLRLIRDRKRASFSQFAAEMGVKKWQVQRIANRLKTDKLAEVFRGRLCLTSKGEKELGVGKGKKDEDFG